MLYAVVARCPVFGGKVKSFDAAKAKTVPGVKQVVQISNGVAVVADNTWSAMQGAACSHVEWDEGTVASHEHAAAHARSSWRQMSQPGAVARKEGDAAAALAAATQENRGGVRGAVSLRTLPWSR